jgi:hypothetical protein
MTYLNLNWDRTGGQTWLWDEILFDALRQMNRRQVEGKCRLALKRLLTCRCTPYHSRNSSPVCEGFTWSQSCDGRTQVDKLMKEKNMGIALRISRTLVACVLFLASAVSFSQTKPGDLVVDIPFNFVVARQHLPAGHYIVAMQSDSVRIFQPQGRSI